MRHDSDRLSGLMIKCLKIQQIKYICRNKAKKKKPWRKIIISQFININTGTSNGRASSRLEARSYCSPAAAQERLKLVRMAPLGRATVSAGSWRNTWKQLQFYEEHLKTLTVIYSQLGRWIYVYIVELSIPPLKASGEHSGFVRVQWREEMEISNIFKYFAI